MSEIFDAFRESGARRQVEPSLRFLADDVRLFASLTSKPFEGKEAVIAVFAMLLEVFDELEYVAEYDRPQGKVILTTGTVGGKAVDGIQVLILDTNVFIREFRDFIRLFSGAVALREAAERYLERHQP